jgi:hypothetical protein
MVFYSQDLTEENEELQEISDPTIIKQVKASLNLTDEDRNDIAPIICGTVVAGGGFNRKLKMMRRDLFMLLSISQSFAFFTDFE